MGKIKIYKKGVLINSVNEVKSLNAIGNQIDFSGSANKQINNAPQFQSKNVYAIKLQKNNQSKILPLKFSTAVKSNEKNSEKMDSE